MGEYDIRVENDGPHEDIEISSSVPHEEYNDPLKINDIALIHLVRHVEFKGHIFLFEIEVATKITNLTFFL